MSADPSGLQGPIQRDYLYMSDPMGAPWRAYRSYVGADSQATGHEFWRTLSKKMPGSYGGLMQMAFADGDQGMARHGASQFAGCSILDLAGSICSPEIEAGEGVFVIGTPKLTPHLLGLEGELAVRETIDIGSKERVYLANGSYIKPDGLTPETLSEVKNVEALGLTKQLRTYLDFSVSTGRKMYLYVRPGTKLSKPLLKEISSKKIILRYIPK